MDFDAIIHAGKAAPDLKNLIIALENVGVREKFFMDDLISTLRYDDDFNLDLNIFIDELLSNSYLKTKLAKGNHVSEYEEITTKFLELTAVASKRVASYLHEALIIQSRYDENGKFPYEFHSFDGKLVFLRALGK